jgi:hypothetical protein
MPGSKGANQRFVNRKLTFSEVRRILDYDPDTGLFRWKHRPEMSGQRNGKFAGALAGNVRPDGCIDIKIHGKLYRSHRIAWFWMTGEWPSAQIDHRDLNRGNNKWNNLREATHSQNLWNRGINASNTSGYKGVSYNKGCKKWQAYISVSGRRRHLGLFATPEEAHAAYSLAATELHGDFARVE